MGQVVWVNYQIMATVAWNVQIKWPAPFATFERLLSILDLSLLRLMPVACIVPCEFLPIKPKLACIVPCEFLPIKPKFPRSNANTSFTILLSRFRRTVDFITDFYVIMLTPLVMAALLIVVGAARATRNPDKRNDIAYVHGSLLLLLSFLVLPATSMKVRERCVTKTTYENGGCSLLGEITGGKGEERWREGVCAPVTTRLCSPR